MNCNPVRARLATSAWLSLSTLVFLTFLSIAPDVAYSDETVQFPVTSSLNARAVTTLTDGKIVTWNIGIDGGGTGDGYLTLAASLSLGDKSPHALPDSGRFPADARHPDVVLHYSNADGTSNQTRSMPGAADFTFAVPAAKYSKLFLFFTSSEGASSLTIQFTYSDATTETKTVEMPDYYADLPTDDPVLFYLAKDLAKWTKTNKMAEANHHNIDGMELHPSADKTLASIKVAKTAKGYLVFWGATGISTSPVTSVFRPRNGTVTWKSPSSLNVRADGRHSKQGARPATGNHSASPVYSTP